MNTNFKIGLKIVLDIEGGFVNDPVDPGGATNMGITQKIYNLFLSKEHKPERSVKSIEPKEVEYIYYNYFWLPSKCNELPDMIDVFHFDTAVNCGNGMAAKILQTALNANEKIKVDGIIGKITLDAIKKYTIPELLACYNVAREIYYEIIIEKNQSLKKFEKGWQNRLTKLMSGIKETWHTWPKES